MEDLRIKTTKKMIQEAFFSCSNREPLISSLW